MRALLIPLVLVSLVGCQTVDRLKAMTNNRVGPEAEARAANEAASKLTEDQKFKEYIEKTNRPASETYRRAKTWAASAYKGNSKDAIQLDEPDRSHFVAKGFVQYCRAMGSARVYDVSFLVDFEAKDGRARILFDKILATAPGKQSGRIDTSVGGMMFNGRYPETQEELELIASNCLEPLKAALFKEISAEKGSKHW